MAAALQHNKRGGKKKWHDSQKEKMKLTAVVVEKVLKKKKKAGNTNIKQTADRKEEKVKLRRCERETTDSHFACQQCRLDNKRRGRTPP